MARLTSRQFTRESAEWPVATEPIEFDGTPVGQHVYIQPPEGDRIHCGQVSTDYALMPNVEAIGVAKNAIENAGFTLSDQEWGTVFNGRRFQTTLVADEGFEPFPNDRFQVGFRITNSYDGSSKLRLDAMLFRVLCANGMISTKFFHGVVLFHRGNELREYSDIAAGLSSAYHSLQTVEPVLAEAGKVKFKWPEFLPTLAETNDQFTGKAVHSLMAANPKTMYDGMNGITEMLNSPRSFGDVNTLDIFTTAFLAVMQVKAQVAL